MSLKVKMEAVWQSREIGNPIKLCRWSFQRKKGTKMVVDLFVLPGSTPRRRIRRAPIKKVVMS